jgi:epoxyqueuosine reductase QueG
MSFQNELKEYLLSQGVSDVGFSEQEECPEGLPYAVTLVVRLSQAIIDEIDSAPTETYFNHYRTVNAFIDRALLQCGLFLQKNGYKYITVAASQSINTDGWNYRGRFSHKQAAVAAGLGSVGRNSLFIHKDFGSSVRLGTVFTDCPFDLSEVTYVDMCGECNLCVDACPAGAIKGGKWEPGTVREDIFDPQKCSEYMKRAFHHIGRGAVCGICMSVCPHNKGE